MRSISHSLRGSHDKTMWNKSIVVAVVQSIIINQSQIFIAQIGSAVQLGHSKE
jgi:hypothetical protein